MMFSKLARIVAWLTLIGGAYKLLLGYTIAFEVFVP